MAITTYLLDCRKHPILDLDADEYGSFIALLSNMEVWWNGGRLVLEQQFRYAWIRVLDLERFLIIGQQLGVAGTGHIFDYTGRKLLTFDAGEYITDVLVQANQIVVSYLDQGAGKKPPSGEGIAVFNFMGQQVFGYLSGGHGFILDCYCMCKKGNDSILAYTYTNFPLRELRLTDYQLAQQPTPADFKGANALSFDRGNIVFYSSYVEKASFFWWNRKDKVKRFGQFGPAPLRGIGAGKFLTFDANSFTIIDAIEMMRQEHSQR